MGEPKMGPRCAKLYQELSERMAGASMVTPFEEGQGIIAEILAAFEADSEEAHARLGPPGDELPW